jgi:predicted DNA-binding transcriptional regulator AlpA
MPIKLWSTADIADELEVARSTVSKWLNEGALPEAYAIGGNINLWTDDQVKEIIKWYYDRTEPRREKKRAADRSEKFLNILIQQDDESTQIGGVAQWL